MPGFPARTARALDEAKYLKIRAGNEHRFIWVWVVVAGGRAFVRPWNDKPAGWYRAFVRLKRGWVVVHDRELPVRGRVVRGARLHDQVSDAYAAKYTTAANQKYVKGFATARRKAKTLELLP